MYFMIFYCAYTCRPMRIGNFLIITLQVPLGRHRYSLEFQLQAVELFYQNRTKTSKQEAWS
jgi:hypothetical protein